MESRRPRWAPLSLSLLLACANCSCTKNVLIFICKNLPSPLSPSLLSPSVPALVRSPFCICCFYYFWHDMKISLENNLLWLWVLVAICSGFPPIPPLSPPLSLLLLPLLVCFLLLFFLLFVCLNLLPLRANATSILMFDTLVIGTFDSAITCI